MQIECTTQCNWVKTPGNYCLVMGEFVCVTPLTPGKLLIHAAPGKFSPSHRLQSHQRSDLQVVMFLTPLFLFERLTVLNIYLNGLQKFFFLLHVCIYLIYLFFREYFIFYIFTFLLYVCIIYVFMLSVGFFILYQFQSHMQRDIKSKGYLLTTNHIAELIKLLSEKITNIKHGFVEQFLEKINCSLANVLSLLLY